MITTEPLEWTYTLEQLDPIYGTLQAANARFYGVISSTGIFEEVFSTGFGTVGPGTAAVGATLSCVSGGPIFADAELITNAFGSQFFFGRTSIPLNGSSVSDPVSLVNLGAAQGTGTFEIGSS